MLATVHSQLFWYIEADGGISTHSEGIFYTGCGVTDSKLRKSVSTGTSHAFTDVSVFLKSVQFLKSEV